MNHTVTHRAFKKSSCFLCLCFYFHYYCILGTFTEDLKGFHGYTTIKATSDLQVSEVKFANPCCLDLSDFHCHIMVEGLRTTSEIPLT